MPAPIRVMIFSIWGWKKKNVFRTWRCHPCSAFASDQNHTENTNTAPCISTESKFPVSRNMGEIKQLKHGWLLLDDIYHHTMNKIQYSQTCCSRIKVEGKRSLGRLWQESQIPKLSCSIHASLKNACED